MEERKPRCLDREGLWNYALRALGGRAHSTGEMREKLGRRAERAEDVEGVLARLKESKYLDDRQFADAAAQPAARPPPQAKARSRPCPAERARPWSLYCP